MINALSIDLEFWYSPKLVTNHVSIVQDDYTNEMVDPILASLDINNITATFFVLGEFAKKYPEIIEKIYQGNHEIASHSYTHRMLYELNPAEFERELIRSKDTLRAITGENPIGFRAPTFSIDESTSWAFDILKKQNFKYDSSVFPCKTQLYGVQNAPINIYKPLMNHITQNDPQGDIVEFPLTVLNQKIRFPISGGFYFRVLPLWMLKRMIMTVNKNRPAIIYVHPWELYPEVPRINLPFSSKFITYYGVKNSMKKFETLLKNFQFAPVRDVIGI